MLIVGNEQRSDCVHTPQQCSSEWRRRAAVTVRLSASLIRIWLYTEYSSDVGRKIVAFPSGSDEIFDRGVLVMSEIVFSSNTGLVFV